MTVPKWQASTLYSPDDVVQPRLSGPVTNQAIVNPGFESGDTAWTKSNTTIVNTGGAPFAGSWFAKMVYAGGANGSVTTTTALPVTPGQTVSVSCMLNPSGFTSGVGGQVRLIWIDASNAVITSITGNPVDVSNGTGWRKSFVSGIAPVNAAKFKVQGEAYNGNAAGVVLFDSFSLTVNGGPSGNPYLYQATQAAAATSAPTEPVWPTSLGGTVVDGGVTWTAIDATVVTWEASPILESGAVEPTWPTTVGEFVSDGTISWEAISRRIEDEKCPNSKVVLILSSKVFAGDEDIVRFSATANPKDWSTEQDAGYLPTGLQSANANDVAVIAQYRGNLTAFNASSFQNWQVDPDPQAMAILDQMEGIGSVWNKAAQPVANDLFYLSQLGVRSVGIAASTDNLAAGDIGMPIDVLVQQAMAVAEGNGTKVLSTYYPGAGQYWLTFYDYPPAALSSISGDLADGYVGDSGSTSFIVTGGVFPYVFAITAGTLPPGKSLATVGDEGVISGQFIGEGDGVAYYDYTFTVNVTDANGNSASKAVTTRVTNFSISGNAPDGYAGESGSGAYTATHGVTPISYSIGAGTAPPGFTLNIDGTYTYAYTAAGVFNFTVLATDDNNNTATLNDTVTVTAADIFQWRYEILPVTQHCTCAFADGDVIGVGMLNGYICYSLDRGVNFSAIPQLTELTDIAGLVKYQGDWYAFGQKLGGLYAYKASGDSFVFTLTASMPADYGNNPCAFVTNGYIYYAPNNFAGTIKLYQFDGTSYVLIDTGIATAGGESIKTISEVSDGWLLGTTGGKLIKTTDFSTFATVLTDALGFIGSAGLGTEAIAGNTTKIYKSASSGDSGSWDSGSSTGAANGFAYAMSNDFHFISGSNFYVYTSPTGLSGSWTQRLDASSLGGGQTINVTGNSTSTLAVYPCLGGVVYIGDVT